MATPDVHPALPPWWDEPEVLARLVSHLLRAEMQQLRPGGWFATGQDDPAGGWHPALDWRHDLGADSLERMQLLTALAEWAELEDGPALERLWAEPTLAAACQALAHGLASRHEAVVFRTSGSTGPARGCRHRLAALWQEVAHWVLLWRDQGLPRPQRVVSLVPAHHIYGFLFSVLWPLAWQRADGQPLPVVDAWRRPPAKAALGLRPGDVVVAVPALWGLLLRSPGDWPAQVSGLCSTAPCPPALAAALGGAGGLQAFLEIYGSSETAGLGVRRWPAADYTLLPYWERVPEGSQEGQDDACAGRVPRFLRQGSHQAVEGPDRLQWQGERRFQPVGRRDQVVQVGGVNVSPATVAAALAARPGVAQAVVRPWGEGAQARLKAFVVPAPEVRAAAQEAELVAALLAWARQGLPPAARPVHIQTGPALPVNAMGKACDWPLPPADVTPQATVPRILEGEGDESADLAG
ncbi:AMP-binding protein [Ideonella livida]|uniref:AMP-binding protein n=1 Tax=Ideonella livida TaxID=2707176 RepID=A0A7C9THE1_9BURK|nr:AMP-binding protein [Ideonella livida]NDY90501.1 AMP-binding protein [Ideonella livida]